jgi:hypothetical protein
MRSSSACSARALRAAILFAFAVLPLRPAAARGPAAPPPVWPQPPDRARIEYVGQLTGPRDFAGGLWKRLGDFAAGVGSREDMVKPTAIAEIGRAHV